MKRLLFALAVGLALLAVPATGRAARVEADPNKEYPVSPEAGPYVICVTAYTGPSAHHLANQLTLHLRQNGWPAYVFDYSAEERRKAQELLDERYKNLPPDVPRRKTVRVEEQWGVLIGGYRDFDGASNDIPKVRQTPWPNLDKTGFDHVTDPSNGAIYQVSPYAQCLATRNPTVRVQKADPNAPDPYWKELNSGRPYNLFKCGKPWTLAVLQFHGTGVIQPRSASSKFLDMLGVGNKSGDMLEASARQAEEVARYLHTEQVARILRDVLRDEEPNLEVYVLHTRSGSIVTVGAYDSKDDRRLQQAAQRLRGMRFGATGIQFFEQPMPMKVPEL
jgi:hypothetical protein